MYSQARPLKADRGPHVIITRSAVIWQLPCSLPLWNSFCARPLDGLSATLRRSIERIESKRCIVSAFTIIFFTQKTTPKINEENWREENTHIEYQVQCRFLKALFFPVVDVLKICVTVTCYDLWHVVLVRYFASYLHRIYHTISL